MSFDQDAFVAEVNTALDQAQAEVKSEVSDGGEIKGEAETDAPGGEVESDGDADVQVNDADAGPADAPAGGPNPEVETEGGEVREDVVGTQIDDGLMVRAIRAGLSMDDIRSFGSDHALERVLGFVEKPADKPASSEPEDLLAKLPKLDPEQFDPEVIQTIESLVSEIKAQREAIAQFKEQHEQVSRSTADAHAREVEAWFDHQVDSLGEDFADALGKGATSAIDRGSAQYAKRDAVANQAAILLAGYNAQGRKAPPREEVFESAARLVLKDEFRKVEEKQLSEKLGKRAGKHIQRVSGQKAVGTKSPEEEVAALLDEKYFGK